MKIVIKNETHWRTRDLRRFVARCAKEVLHEEYRKRTPDIRIRFKHSRSRRGENGSCGGHAYLGGSFASIRVPKPFVDRVDLAFVLAHEMGHLLGMEHRDMAGGALWDRTGRWRELYAWAETLPLERKGIRAPTPPRAPAPPRNIKAENYAKLLARLKRWTTKYRRAQTAISKLTQAKRRYEREGVVAP